eukprot:TRINITY_DN4319_c0_g2_i2.p1 TRINITY_DN4319_c0_g2~~TRINITY_DN4319_c0_g2_i2.p1  ORF type:complete len:332 (-),score=133.03 TRINITY_DN4319_c0_g2_i2:429-1424(-)
MAQVVKELEAAEETSDDSDTTEDYDEDYDDMLERVLGGDDDLDSQAPKTPTLSPKDPTPKDPRAPPKDPPPQSPQAPKVAWPPPIAFHKRPGQGVRRAECGWATANWVLGWVGLPAVSFDNMQAYQATAQVTEEDVHDGDDGDDAPPLQQISEQGWFSWTCLDMLFKDKIHEDMTHHKGGRLKKDVTAVLFCVTSRKPGERHWAVLLKDGRGGWNLKDTQRDAAKLSYGEARKLYPTAHVGTLTLSSAGLRAAKAGTQVAPHSVDGSSEESAPAKKAGAKKAGAKKAPAKKAGEKKVAAKKAAGKRAAPRKVASESSGDETCSTEESAPAK